jgi:ABC-type sulfate/molybdate transport systems ATPase subunit
LLGPCALCGAEQALVLLDEPTAQLDVRGEAEVFDKVLQATRGVTTILISHRFSTVRHADRICVLEHGRVIELGSHQELMAQGGRYQTMFELQAKRFEATVDEEGAVFDVLWTRCPREPALTDDRGSIRRPATSTVRHVATVPARLHARAATSGVCGHPDVVPGDSGRTVRVVAEAVGRCSGSGQHPIRFSPWWLPWLYL